MIAGVIALAVIVVADTAALLIACQRAPWCSCGHSRTAHGHYHSGTECSMRTEDGTWCECRRFIPPIILRRAVWQ